MSYTDSQLCARYNKRFQSIDPKISVLEATAVLVANVLVIVGAAAGSLMLFRVDATVGVLGYLLAVILIGTRLRSFGNIVHECVHYAFVSNRRWNEIFGNLLSIILLYSFEIYRKHHISHHLHTGHYENDLEFSDTKRYGFHEPLDGPRFARHLKRLITFEYVPYYIGRTVFDRTESLSWRAVRSLYIFGLSAICVLGGGWLIVLGYIVVPFLTTLPAISYVTDVLDHAGLIRRKHDLERSRNYVVDNRLVHVVFFPRNDSYHLVHHLFPSVPTKMTPQCHEILMQEVSEYRALPHTLRDWLRVIRDTR